MSIFHTLKRKLRSRRRLQDDVLAHYNPWAVAPDRLTVVAQKAYPIEQTSQFLSGLRPEQLPLEEKEKTAPNGHLQANALAKKQLVFSKLRLTHRGFLLFHGQSRRINRRCRLCEVSIQTLESSPVGCDKHRMDDCGRGREPSATAMGGRA